MRFVSGHAQRGTDSYFEFLRQSEHRPWMMQAISVPLGIPEYFYVSANIASERGLWTRSLSSFETAVSYRSFGWPSGFYEGYGLALSKELTGVSERMSEEKAMSVTERPRILVGSKERSGWANPVMLAGQWSLEGISVRSWAALDHGFPLDIDLFWRHSTSRSKCQTVHVENVLPNAGFELSRATVRSKVPGWYTAANDNLSKEVSVGRTLHREGRVTVPVVIGPGGPNRTPVLDTAYLPLERHTTYFLWNAWVEAPQSGNPHIFVFWFDGKKRSLGFEVPLANVPTGDGSYFAGVLLVPAEAVYVQIRLANVQAAAEAKFDDLILVPIVAFRG